MEIPLQDCHEDEKTICNALSTVDVQGTLGQALLNTVCGLKG